MPAKYNIHKSLVLKPFDTGKCCCCIHNDVWLKVYYQYCQSLINNATNIQTYKRTIRCSLCSESFGRMKDKAIFFRVVSTPSRYISRRHWLYWAVIWVNYFPLRNVTYDTLLSNQVRLLLLRICWLLIQWWYMHNT